MRCPRRRSRKVKAVLQAIANAEGRGQAEASVPASLWHALSESGGAARARLGANAELLCVSEGALATSADHIVESPFDAVRLRTSAAKRYKRVDNASAIIWRLLLVVDQHFRKLNTPERCRDVYDNKTFSMENSW